MFINSLLLYILMGGAWFLPMLGFIVVGIDNGEYAGVLVTPIIVGAVLTVYHRWAVSDKKVLQAQFPDAVEWEDVSDEVLSSYTEHAKGMGIDLTKSPIRMVVVGSGQANAFVVKRWFGGHTIYVTTRLFEILNPAELTGVMAHEFAHIKAGDTTFQTAMHMLSSLNAVAGNTVRVAAVLNIWARVFFAFMTLALLPYKLLMELVYASGSRRREYRADAIAAGYLGEKKHWMSDALTKMESDSGQAKNSFFNSHPPTQKRIEAIAAV